MWARIVGWPVAKTMQATPAPLKLKIATTSLDVTGTNVDITMTTPMIRRSMPDLVALSLVSGRSRSKRTIQAHLVWTAYSIVHARYMAPQTNQPIIPTGIAGCLNRPAS